MLSVMSRIKEITLSDDHYTLITAYDEQSNELSTFLTKRKIMCRQ